MDCSAGRGDARDPSGECRREGQDEKPTPMKEKSVPHDGPPAGSGAVRHLGLLSATGIGVGAIVGGGILALAGVAFATTGPSAIVAFAANGVIALLTALTFAEMATAFPESGGTYNFAKKVLSVEAAFMVGWVVWFASIVAAVLYALGFASFFVPFLAELWPGGAPGWLEARWASVALALLATAFYTFGLIRRSSGGGQWETAGKVVVFVVLVAGGAWVLLHRPAESLRPQLTPFFAAGTAGLFQAMGYTFIALQGFDLIAAVAGEVRDPGRNLPRSMILSLGIALAIYLPLLFIVTTVGVEAGGSITEAAAADPETVLATAVENYLGRTGFWLVIVAAILSMLSALQANLLAASRVALAMAHDRNLPGTLGELHAQRHTPVPAILATSLTVAAILLVIPNVAAAGAVSSLIFLISFALAHGTNYLAQRRGGSERRDAFRLPFYPLVPVLGGVACVALAVFQGLSVPTAGVLAAVWLGVGGALFLALFARRAQVADAAAEALDPSLVRLRGRSPLVLVPIANPASARSMVEVANALAPPAVGRVLLLSVVATPDGWDPESTPQQLVYAQQVLGESLTASFAAALDPEALITVSREPWAEILRVARTYRCESLLLGLGELDAEADDPHLEEMMIDAGCDVVVLRAPRGFHLAEARRVLVPVGGRRDQSRLRARLLGSLARAGARDVTFLGVFPEGAPPAATDRARQDLADLAEDEAPGRARVEVVRSDDVVGELVHRAAGSDLLILGLQRRSGRRRLFGEIPTRVARETGCPIILISRGG